MAKSKNKNPAFTTVGEATIDGQTFVSEPIPFTLAGLSLRAQVMRDSAGAPVFKVMAGPSPGAGFARFEKTCMEPVLFNVYRDGEPMQQVVVPSFQIMTLSLEG